MGNFVLAEDMRRYVGKTVTIFTTSGGISGAGFTGVLAWADDRIVKLITRIGAPPACPLGSTCTGIEEEVGRFGRFGGFGPGEGFGRFGGFGMREGFGRFGGGCGCGCGEGVGGFASDFLGAVTEIPMHSIASFTHNAI